MGEGDGIADMRIFGKARRGNARRRFADCAVLVLFLLQAFLPAGFMPDISALRQGTFEIVVCTGTGFETLTVDENGNPVSKDETTPTGHIDKSKCPFGGVTLKPTSTLFVPIVAVPTYGVVPWRHMALADLGPTSEPGPFLGPRAPPSFLG